MKIRNGWVGNSSSSSFVIVGDYPKELVDKYGSYWLMKLEGERKDRAIQHAKWEINSDSDFRWFTRNDVNKDLLDQKDKDVYLTTFIGDDSTTLFGDVTSLPNAFLLYEGGHGQPYDIDNFEELVMDEFWLKLPIDQIQ